jgi:hypothetical protein
MPVMAEIAWAVAVVWRLFIPLQSGACQSDPHKSGADKRI